MESPHEDGCDFYVAGVGASAGGLEALEEFFHHMPEKTGIAFVVIQHLSPDFESHMAQLLGRQTQLPIYQASEGMEVHPDAIYLIPPRKEMIISEGRLRLTDKDPSRSLTLPIDHFFRSLAQDCGRFSIGVVLSGSGSDGARGIQKIHEAGGLVLVQSEETAKFNGMPHSAIATRVPDLVLSPRKMPSVLVQYVEYALSREQISEQGFEISEDRGVQKIVRLLRDEYNIDFNIYKQQTVMRRIERRLALVNCTNVEEYADRLAESPEQLDDLYRDLLIGVTRFFRDPEAYEHLQQQIIPQLVEESKETHEIRCWVAGCATGEEVYSLAMLLQESLDDLEGNLPHIKIFATDVHRESLERASRGMYDEEALAEVSRVRRERFFTRKPDGYQVVSSLRQMIVFATHNVLTDAPFTRLDLVSCRNLLIYFQPNGQSSALSLFHFGLKTGGYLWLGPSESPGDLGDEFDVLDKRWKIYRKRAEAPTTPPFRSPSRGLPPITRPAHVPQVPARRGVSETKLNSAYDQLISRFLPAAYLTDDRMQLLHTFGDGHRFLQVRPGRHSSNLQDLIHPDLRTSLIGAVQSAMRSNQPARFSGLGVEMPDGHEVVQMVVEPLAGHRDQNDHLLISIERDSVPGLSESPPHKSISADAAADQRIEALENELQATRENLRSTIEELETSNEELQATNEEMVASNEELQSTNEELHSVNEELYTVNAEYQKKIVELQELNEDLDNLFSNSDLIMVFLDHDLSIRKFTPQMAKLFHLLPRDVGRPLTSFSHQINYPELSDDLQRALATEDSIERQVTDRYGVPYLLRIVSYRSAIKASGLVMTLVDISALKSQEEEARRWASIAESTGDAIIGMNLDGTIATWNQSAERIMGFPQSAALGKSIYALMIPEEKRAELQGAFETLRNGASARTLETTYYRQDGRPVEVSVNLSAIREADQRISGISAIIRDITQKRHVERQLAADHAVTQVLADSTTLEQAIPDVLEGLCQTLDAAVVEYWVVDPEGQTISIDQTHFSDSTNLGRRWRTRDRQRNYGYGEKLPGRVWQQRGIVQFTGESENDASATEEKRHPDILTSVGFPVQGNDDVLSVITLSFKRRLDPDEGLFPLLESIGKEIGQFAQWARNEAHLRRLAEIIERTDDLVATCDLDHTIQTLNPAGARLLGLTVDECLGRSLLEFQPEWSIERITKEGMPIALEHGIWTGETALTNSAHEEIPISQAILVHRDKSGAICYLSTIARNLSSQKNAERSLHEARAQAEAANAAKSAFLANMSHEVRTPMTAVIGLTELLLESEADPHRRHLLEMVQENGDYLTELLNDILDLSKIEAGRLDVDLSECSIVELIDELFSLMNVRARRQGLELEMNYQTPVPAKVLVDPIRVRQILSNLVANAIKFTDAGRVAILVRYDGDESKLSLAVEDTGCGIPADAMDSIFDPFSQVDGQQDRKAKGTGLGLSISRRLAEALHGELTVDSQVDVGTTFTLTLPVKVYAASDLVDAAQLHQSVEEAPQREDDYDLSGIRLLVAEDTPTNQFLLQRLLTSRGAQVDLAADGVEAVERAQQASTDGHPQYDLIVMDMNMPRMTGYEATEKLRRAGFDRPIIALTASAMRGDRERCLAVGCTTYTTKPIDRNVLLHEIKRMMSSPASHDGDGHSKGHDGHSDGAPGDGQPGHASGDGQGDGHSRGNDA